eukprot:Ihof_evm1s377 gene=Ihof_evmTU1s377
MATEDRKRQTVDDAAVGSDSERNQRQRRNVLAHFKDENGEYKGPPLDLPQDVTQDQLQMLLNQIQDKDEAQKYTFFVKDVEVTGNVGQVVEELNLSTEQTVEIVYRPQALFRVRAVTRCSASIPGHSEAILSVSFSPDGRQLASGGGDTTVRFWDVNTNGPAHTCKEHKNWVLYVAWSPDAKKLASGGRDTEIYIWDPKTGQRMGKPLKGHKKYITCISWEPMHANPKCNRLVSASKDGTVKIWDLVHWNCSISLSLHIQSVTSVIWGGQGLIYSASQDRTIKVWRADDGVLCRSLDGHAHWVNCMALNTDYVLRTGAFDYRGIAPTNEIEAKDTALVRYNKVLQDVGGVERLVSGSDDFTMYMWDPATTKKPITRMTGHQQLINHVCFSPDGRLVASGSFDKSVKIWDGRTGKFLASMRGHVGAVYQVCWSADSRMLVSASKDSTMKVWDSKTKKLTCDLPGHADEVYAVDWSPDGQRVASGGKDRVIK